MKNKILTERFALGESEFETGHLGSAKLALSYFYDQTYGLTAGYFDKKGGANNMYGETADGASNTPDASGYTLQADWTPWGKDSSWLAPWANVRLGLQYTGYTKFNGASSNYDGNGRNAKDNNTLMGFVWFAW